MSVRQEVGTGDHLHSVFAFVQAQHTAVTAAAAGAAAAAAERATGKTLGKDMQRPQDIKWRPFLNNELLPDLGGFESTHSEVLPFRWLVGLTCSQQTLREVEPTLHWRRTSCTLSKATSVSMGHDFDARNCDEQAAAAAEAAIAAATECGGGKDHKQNHVCAVYAGHQ